MSDDTEVKLSEEDAQALKRYMIFSNGDGYMVLEDLKHVFRQFKSDEFNEELGYNFLLIADLTIDVEVE